MNSACCRHRDKYIAITGKWNTCQDEACVQLNLPVNLFACLSASFKVWCKTEVEEGMFSFPAALQGFLGAKRVAMMLETA